MRDFLSKNLYAIEPGLRLYTGGVTNGIEVPVRITDWGRQGAIDLLAVDKGGAFVVIECKQTYGKAAGFGQVLGYMAWLKACLTSSGRSRTRLKSPNIRGFLVCKRASPSVRLLLDNYPMFDVTVFEYEHSVDFELAC